MNSLVPLPDLDAKVRFLGSTRAYGATSEVKVIETHMSWVFLTGRLVYKFKKPVRYPFLDFTTLEQRHRHCTAELTLNRRLAPRIYRRLVPLTLEEDGTLALEGGGKIVEWLIEMERLPEQDMLDARLRRGDVPSEAVVGVGDTLGRFYAEAPPQPHDGHAYVDHLLTETAVNRQLLLRSGCPVPRSRAEALLDRVERLIERAVPLIRERIERGWIVEGHGDLRPEHVCLGPVPQIIDCLEFDRDMRLLDPYDEVNYLGLECQFMGAGWVRPLLLGILDTYLERRPEPRLMATYGAFRGMLRARISIAHLLDAVPMEPERWPGEAQRYMDLAERECITAEA